MVNLHFLPSDLPPNEKFDYIKIRKKTTFCLNWRQIEEDAIEKFMKSIISIPFFSQKGSNLHRIQLVSVSEETSNQAELKIPKLYFP